MTSLTLALAVSACAEKPKIVCTPGGISACFGIEVVVEPIAGSNDTRVNIHVQNLQGTVAEDNTAWSQLLYLRVYRNMEPALGFPSGGAVKPIWLPSVTTIGPSAPGSGWKNTGVSSPPGVNEWLVTGGSVGADVGYIAGRDQTFNEVVKAGAGLRTFSGVGNAPGWVTFTFVAGESFTAADVGVQLSAWASKQPASGRPVPAQVGCQVLSGGGPVEPDCVVHPYNLDE